MDGPAQLPEKPGSGEKKPPEDRGGEGAGGGWGSLSHPRPGAWEDKERHQPTRLVTTCPDKTRFILHPGRRSLPVSPCSAAPRPPRAPPLRQQQSRDQRPRVASWLAAPGFSPRSAQLGRWKYSGEPQHTSPVLANPARPVDGAQNPQTCQERKNISCWLVQAGPPWWIEECLAFPQLLDLRGNHWQPPEDPHNERPGVCRSLLDF